MSLLSSRRGRAAWIMRDRVPLTSGVARNLREGVRNCVLFAARCYASAALAVMRCLSLCPSVTFVDSVKTNNRIVKLFHRRVATPFWFSHTKRHGNIPTGTPLTGASICWGRQNRDSEPISGFTACCEPFQRQVQVHSCNGPWQVYNTSRW